MSALFKVFPKKNTSCVLFLRLVNNTDKVNSIATRGRYSSQVNNAEDDSDVIKSKLFKASLSFVQEHGFSRKALHAGAQSIGLPSISHGLFPRGGVDLALYYYADCNVNLSKFFTIEAEKNQKKSVHDFIYDAVQKRLSMIIPYVDHWPKAMSMMLLPSSAPKALKNLSVLVDDIWYHAGDRSTDFNWYTKRLSLAAVYKSTELCLIQDKSPEYQDTWKFLNRRLNEVEFIGGTFGQLVHLPKIIFPRSKFLDGI